MSTYLITDFGAKPNSPEFQTETIQKVLVLCKEEGGLLVIPNGKFSIYRLRLRSDTTLKLESGA